MPAACEPDGQTKDWHQESLTPPSKPQVCARDKARSRRQYKRTTRRSNDASRVVLATLNRRPFNAVICNCNYSFFDSCFRALVDHPRPFLYKEMPTRTCANAPHRPEHDHSTGLRIDLQVFKPLALTQRAVAALKKILNRATLRIATTTPQWPNRCPTV